MKAAQIIMKNAHAIARTLEGDYIARLGEGLRIAHANFKAKAIKANEAKISELDPCFGAKGLLSAFSGIYISISSDVSLKVDSQYEMDILISKLISKFGNGYLTPTAPGTRNNRYTFVNNQFADFCEANKGNFFIKH